MPKEKLENRLRRHYRRVIQRMVVDYYVTELHAASCFADVDVDLLDELKGRSRAKQFVNILMCKGERVIQAFLDIARQPDKQPQLYAEIIPNI
jgi:hypothetical protein